MIFLDTGYLIALAKPRDTLHDRALAWTAALHEPLVVTEFVLLETVDALSLPADRDKAHALIEDLRALEGCRIIPVSSELRRLGLRFHRARPDKEWSLTDCISFHVMKALRIHRALAHDQHFAQAGFEALLRRDPS
jgi:hypothetical protein